MTIQEEFRELGQFDLEPELIRLLPLAVCHEHHAVVLGRSGGAESDTLTIGMVDPDNQEAIRKIGEYLGRQLAPVRLNLYEVNKALDVGYGQKLIADRETGHVIDLAAHDGKTIGHSSEAPDLVDQILIDSMLKKASDIHLEHYFGDSDLRYRVDGILRHEFSHITPGNISKVVNRIKILSGMDITENRLPQDGRFRCTMVDGDLKSATDFRVSVLPGPTGQDVVIRALKTDIAKQQVDQLGMPPQILESFMALVQNPEGLILATGPTGSGKTTTLYAALNQVRDKGRKIITAEDPIEYYVDKVNQKQVSDQISMAILSRSFLRHDPDVMLIGEIRDLDTAETASKAAATGHLVLSTLHTPDAIGAVQRFRGLGLENDEIAHALLGVMAQRLLRKVCPLCAQEAEPDEKQARLLGALLEGVKNLEGKGCAECMGTGFKGRIGIFELLVVDDNIQNIIYENAPGAAIRALARQKGFSVMLEDAMDKVAKGITSVGEIFRVIPYRQLLITAKELNR